MRIHHGISPELRQQLQFPVVTAGTFDGVHPGHRSILQRLREAALQHQGETVLITFTPHPRAVISGNPDAVKLLTTDAEKAALLEAAGLDHLIFLPFTSEFASWSYTRYVSQILVEGIGTRLLVIGYDHQFGHSRQGTIEQLQQMAPQSGFLVEEIPARLIDETKVSSSRIRKLLESGDVEDANRLLGYRYGMSGIVGAGRKIGRQIGFPTANITRIPAEKLVPATGVYAVEAMVGNDRVAGMMNIGTNPTVESNGDSTLRVEAHLIGFDRDIYNEQISVRFVKRLRNEMKFESLQHLQVQLLADKEHAIAALGL
jgi:riboflavin kinase/FMN adenylyltransferase